MASISRSIARGVVRWVAPLARHPMVGFVTGLGLVVSGLADLLEDVFTGFETFLETYHGLILFGVVTALRGFAEVMEGMEWISRDIAAEEREEN